MFRNLSYPLVITVGAMFFVGCGDSGQGQEDSEPMQEEVSAPACTYTYDHSSTGLFWTAYKHTAKVGVVGRFDSLHTKGAQVAEHPQDVMKGVGFKVYTSSINSNDAERDRKIREALFEKMVGSSEISGTIQAVEGDEQEGTVSLLLTMNGVEKELSGTYTIEADKLEMKVTVDINAFDGQEALTSLNEACKERHTGTDGKSTTWPDVYITVKTVLKKECE